MKKYGREVVLSMTGGSSIRNLNDEQSDIDLKFFVLPTFEDLYSKEVFTKFVATPEVDEDVQDIRRLEKLLFKSNPSYLDLLFSPDIKAHSLKTKEIINMRDEIARINLSSLYSSSMGMYNQAKNDILTITSDKTNEMIQKNGYNTKKFMLALHFLRTIEQYHKSGFNNYGKAIWYEGLERDYMIGAKRGKFSWSEAQDILDGYEQKVTLLKEDYKSQPVDEETNTILKMILRELVLKEL